MKIDKDLWIGIFIIVFSVIIWTTIMNFDEVTSSYESGVISTGYYQQVPDPVQISNENFSRAGIYRVRIENQNYFVVVSRTGSIAITKAY